MQLSHRTLQRLAVKIRELTPRNWGQSLRACMRQLSSYVHGWMNGMPNQLVYLSVLISSNSVAVGLASRYWIDCLWMTTAWIYYSRFAGYKASVC